MIAMKAGAVLAAVGVAVVAGVAPPAAATMYLGNYAVNIPDRRDFHTWIWSALTPCEEKDRTPIPNCINVLTIPQPVAKAQYTNANATMVDGRWTMTVDDPFGLRCGNIYYGPTIPTHDVYSWDATTLAGQMVSSFAVGCDGAPGGSFIYPFNLTRM